MKDRRGCILHILYLLLDKTDQSVFLAGWLRYSVIFFFQRKEDVGIILGWLFVRAVHSFDSNDFFLIVCFGYK